MKNDIQSVLLVESHAVLALCEAKSLRSAGYAVVIAHSAEEAIKSVHTSTYPFDLVLVDLRVTREGGGEWMMNLIRNVYGLPVLLISDSSEQKIVGSIDGTVAYGLVPKNAAREVLLAFVKSAVRLHTGQRLIERSQEQCALARNRIPEQIMKFA